MPMVYTNVRLKKFDTELYEKITRDFDRNEIRGSELVVLEDWIAKALVTESLLGLLRKDMIEINGLNPENMEPTFKQFEGDVDFDID